MSGKTWGDLTVTWADASVSWGSATTGIAKPPQMTARASRPKVVAKVPK